MMKTIGEVGIALTGVFTDHPWILFTIIIFAGLVFLISLLLKNNALTESFAKKINDEDTNSIVKEMGETVSKIREDQMISNKNREDMSTKLDDLSDRMDDFSDKGKILKKNVDYLLTFHKRNCVNKEEFNKNKEG